MNRRTFIVRDAKILGYLKSELARYLREGITPQCEIGEYQDKRTLDQNALLHAMIDDIAQQATYCGRTMPPESWKALFVSAHAVATKQEGEVIIGMEGELVAIRESTAQMGKGRASSLIEYVKAWAAMNDVDLRDDQRETA